MPENDPNTNPVPSFDHLPSMVADLRNKVDAILLKLSERENEQVRPVRKRLSVQECATYLGKAVTTIYAMTSEGIIPHYKVGNRLYFYEDELDDLIAANGRVSMRAESIEEHADRILQSHDRKPQAAADREAKKSAEEAAVARAKEAAIKQAKLAQAAMEAQRNAESNNPMLNP
mgnify:FL=1